MRLKFLCLVDFDAYNGMDKYKPDNAESNHHEAAFDAFMTGYCIPFSSSTKRSIPSREVKFRMVKRRRRKERKASRVTRREHLEDLSISNSNSNTTRRSKITSRRVRKRVSRR